MMVLLDPLDEISPDMNEKQDADRQHQLNPTEEEAVVQPGTEIFQRNISIFRHFMNCFHTRKGSL